MKFTFTAVLFALAAITVAAPIPGEDIDVPAEDVGAGTADALLGTLCLFVRSSTLNAPGNIMGHSEKRDSHGSAGRKFRPHSTRFEECNVLDDEIQFQGKDRAKLRALSPGMKLRVREGTRGATK
ncbi:hypothetical protein B0H16DRAFT_1474729 [Mycena metata]|uniref:Uncharacterized protein n=1 Tax=Mycena metata TaxID=1033252 RepID=A0AAD7HGU2_9AGAR|nr:hypothetical protein B0H16DRAFT_1474729 [Mycena metata]